MIGASTTDYAEYWMMATARDVEKRNQYLSKELSTFDRITQTCQAVANGLYGLSLMIGGYIIAGVSGVSGVGLVAGVHISASGLSRLIGSFTDLHNIYNENFEEVGKNDIMANGLSKIGYIVGGEDGAVTLRYAREYVDGIGFLYALGLSSNPVKPSKYNILSNKTLTNQTGKVENYVSSITGDLQAKSEFYALNPNNIKVYDSGVIVGYLEDGRVVNLHLSSTLNGVPTIEIYSPISGLSIKIRY